MRVFLALVVLLAPASFAVGLAPGPCEGYRFVFGQGPSCPDPAGWRVLLPDGAGIPTHGPDPAPTDVLAPAAVVSGLTGGPVCVPEDEPHHLLIFARPSRQMATADTRAGAVRTLVAVADAKLNAEAATFGRSAHYRFLCEPNGLLRVDVAVLPTDPAVADFGTIVSDLRALGYTDPLAKYWIFYNAQIAAGYGGQGSFWSDDRPGPENKNNYGPSYAITYGYLDAKIMMHESGHNLGAVQHSAPHSSGAAHCNDGVDVMCYADGGRTSNYNTNSCRLVERWDCGHDDYFSMAPAPGSYLATHWNLGSPVNRWIAFG